MKAIAFVFLFISSLIKTVVAAPYYGVLDGGSTLTFSAPVSGVVLFSIDETERMSILKNRTLYEIKSKEISSDKNIALLKLKDLKNKNTRLSAQLNVLKKGVSQGFVSENDFYIKLDELNENEMNIRLTENELTQLSFLEEQSTPLIKGSFIFREVFVSNGQFVKSGDKIAQVTTLDKLIIRIKVDPVVSTEFTSGKIVNFRSLVNNNVTGTGKITSISSEAGPANTDGLKIVTITIPESSDILPLIDTAFEVYSNDKN
ncbi:HlyD family secretion protein [Citrobacter sp. L55]|uniref:HlyD family secretion protein n=1 Tax=Citrobacter sp. L55 TaxID=1981983 RepID=UPI0011805542|nr:HlyD family secretion protein [Citrobacter sp. L55]